MVAGGWGHLGWLDALLTAIYTREVKAGGVGCRGGEGEEGTAGAGAGTGPAADGGV